LYNQWNLGNNSRLFSKLTDHSIITGVPLETPAPLLSWGNLADKLNRLKDDHFDILSIIINHY